MQYISEVTLFGKALKENIFPYVVQTYHVYFDRVNYKYYSLHC